MLFGPKNILCIDTIIFDSDGFFCIRNAKPWKMSQNLKNVTTGDDLKRILKSCKKCWLATKYGKNVICHTELISIKITKKNNLPMVFICNTSDELFTIGHWFTIVINRKYKKVYMCDGLNFAKTQKNVMKNIHQFCKLNSLQFTNLNVKCQPKNTSSCGLISTFFVAKYTHLSLKSFRQLPKIFKRNSIVSNQSIVLQFVQNHFQFKI